MTFGTVNGDDDETAWGKSDISALYIDLHADEASEWSGMKYSIAWNLAKLSSTPRLRTFM